MNRFKLVLSAFFVLLPLSVSAANTVPTKYDPPLMEDMVKLEVYQDLKQLPELNLTRDQNGVTNLSESKGKVVLLNVWATWCPPCVKELPSLNALQLALGGDDFQVITVSMDKGTEGQKAASKFMEDNGLKALTPYVDGYEQLNKLDALKDVPGIPVTLILDRKMRVLARYQGDADWNGRAARAVLEYYIKNSASYNPYEGMMGNY